VNYLLSQEQHALNQNPVENFGAPEVKILMAADTKNAFYSPTQSLAGD